MDLFKRITQNLLIFLLLHEDLDVFLADVELDCETILQKTLNTPKRSWIYILMVMEWARKRIL